MHFKDLKCLTSGSRPLVDPESVVAVQSRCQERLLRISRRESTQPHPSIVFSYPFSILVHLLQSVQDVAATMVGSQTPLPISNEFGNDY